MVPGFFLFRSFTPSAKLNQNNILVNNSKADYNFGSSEIGAWRSPASALAWGARGPGFNSRRPD
jgi:hypothetical protein